MTADSTGCATSVALPLSARPLPRHPRLRRLGTDTAYLLLRGPLSLAGLVGVTAGLLLGAGTLVVWIGVAVLPGALLLARGLAAVERRLIPAVLGRPVPAPRYLPPAGRPVRRLTTPLRDPQCWLDALHAVISPVVALPGLLVTLVLWYLTLVGLSYGAWDWAVPQAENEDLLEVLGVASTAGRRIALYTAIGLVAAVLLPFALRAAALLQAQLSRLLLTGRAATQAELGRLADGRDAALAAEASALRRLERDIHDGPQQRLVRLTMDLSRAQRQLDRAPDTARATLAEATVLARETLEELRALSRGIAPPVLADRGLAAALSAVSARSAVPVELTVDLSAERLPPVVENTAYFVVSEALANVVKHSRAAVCRVTVTVTGDRLRVTVEDDGEGGAVPLPGHGLAGLSDRLRAVDGALTLDSPAGGPTLLTAVLPCG